ncbi:MAG: pyridoxine 5'-phosphate synthase [Pedosphaera sp.]|nr:pyridoxine 5'-phosphate synthase [Pedosphaera sp.]
MLKLGVNIDHVATLRQARYRGQPGGEPDPVTAALLCEAAGAHGITAHLREDRRHIIDNDVHRLRRAIRTRLNLEMANVPEMVEIALDVHPEIVCLVPERRDEISTEGGLDAAGAILALTETCLRLNNAGIEVSLFIGPEPRQVEAAAQIGAQFIELHTGNFAEHFEQTAERNREIERLVAAATLANQFGLRVNAGHGLNVRNVPLLHVVPHMVELNIGHTLVSRAIQTGLAAAVREMLDVMKGYIG